MLGFMKPLPLLTVTLKQPISTITSSVDVIYGRSLTSVSSFFFRDALTLEEDEEWEDDKGRKYWTQTDFLYHREHKSRERRSCGLRRIE